MKYTICLFLGVISQILESNKKFGASKILSLWNPNENPNEIESFNFLCKSDMRVQLKKNRGKVRIAYPT